MGADENTKTIQMVYEAFDRGDVQAILDAVTDDVDWATETSSTVAPWFGVRHGKDGVASFFEAFGSTMEIMTMFSNRSDRGTMPPEAAQPGRLTLSRSTSQTGFQSQDLATASTMSSFILK